MQTGYQEGAVDRKLLAGVAVVLALILIAFCYVVFLLIRSKQADRTAQPQLIQTEIPITTGEPVALYLPVVIKPASPAPAPTAKVVTTSTLWRFISINDNDIGTFENTGDPKQRLTAKCIDIKRPAPEKGELYTLEDSGILKPQSGSKKFQRFEVIARQ
jgi:hypothetical protein